MPDQINALIVGGTSGIGREIAHALAKRGEEVIVTAVFDSGPEEVARHRRSAPGNPPYSDEHFGPAPEGPLHRSPAPKTKAEADFLAIGEGAALWLSEAGAAGRCDHG